MSTYTTNTKPESKFEDVPEEVLTDPTMRTALGMDPIPGITATGGVYGKTLIDGVPDRGFRRETGHGFRGKGGL